MTSINIPRDDLGTLDLKLKNKTSEAITPAHESEAAPPIQESHNHPEPLGPLPQHEQRRKKDRRQKDRRQKQIPVLLDTRVQGDRRQHGRRRSDSEPNPTNDATTEQPVPQTKGFDDFA